MAEKNKVTEKIILGLDPGTTVMGYGIISIIGKKMTLIQYGVIQLAKYKDHGIKLNKIFERVTQIIDEYHPDEISIEAPFFGKNVQSMLKLGRAQGVAIAAAISREVPVVEYAPKKVKMAVTGNGNASKEQVAAMLEILLKFKDTKGTRLLDATDALGVAVCHYMQKGETKKSNKGWSTFLDENPERNKTK